MKKLAMVVPDGCADFPLDELGGKTPLEAASTPAMDAVARNGTLGTVRTIPEGMPPGSDVANMSLLGYEPSVYHTGRAPIEAASMGVELSPDEVAFRMNLVNLDGGRMADYSAGAIPAEEARELVSAVAEALKETGVKVFPGVSYRNLLVARRPELVDAVCTPPHDITGEPFEQHLPRGEGAGLLKGLMDLSAEVLAGHPVNRARAARGELPANSIWLWGQGTRPEMPLFRERFGMRGAAISAVDLIRGLARLAGIDVIDVPGATGYYDTNYRGKGEAAVRALGRYEFVFVHIEAPDEAGHNGELGEKTRAIEMVDEHVVGPLLESSRAEGAGLVVASDHPTPLSVRTHTDSPVPFAACGEGIARKGGEGFSERAARATGVYHERGWELLPALIGGAYR